jgi:outer membrane protein, multidrug efflux system
MPNLQDPLPKAPEKFKEQQISGGEIWKTGEPSDDKDKGEWWKIFNDEKLNELQLQSVAANQSLKAALERVKQARSEAGVARGGLFPDASASFSATSQGGTNARFPGASSYRQSNLDIYNSNIAVSYELDLFGQKSSSYLSAILFADAQEATYKNVLLALQADLVQNYFTLRLLDEQIRILKETVQIRQLASDFIKHQRDAGTSSDLDYSRVLSELETSKADMFGVQKIRSQTEHAMAILLGKNPSEFSFEYSPLASTVKPPIIPVGLPSKLLERRPDVAAAQRQMASANARIGVARAVFFPSISLGVSGGTEASGFSKAFQWVSRTWAVGPNVNIPIFSGGSNFANLDKTKAKFEEEVANYRQTALNAFREVEDGLSNTRYLTSQEEASAKAAESAKKAAKLSMLRYKIGESNYLDVVDSERTRFATEFSNAQVRIERYNATIALIRALGGGWN